MSVFRIKLDENLGRFHQELLRCHGYDAETVHAERLSGMTDVMLWSRVVDEGRFLVTLDLHFSDVRRFQPGTHPGILLVRGRSGSSAAVLEVLQRVIAEQPLEELRGVSRCCRRARYPNSAPESLAGEPQCDTSL